MGKGWYILVGVTVALIALLWAFAAYMTVQNDRANCAPSAVNCGAPPPSTP